MKTNTLNLPNTSSQSLKSGFNRYTSVISSLLVMLLFLFGSMPAQAHCDSYDGPTIKDAVEALKTNNVNLVLKWINQEQEDEIIALFNKTYSLKSGDKEVYTIVEKHFFETLVRLHRETEGAPFTGLKPAGSTKVIVQLTDEALANRDIEGLLTKLNNHIGKVIKEKYEILVALDKVKNESAEKGREYVKAYVDYTHTVEAIHDIIDPVEGNVAHKH